jgi:hypothetical protein
MRALLPLIYSHGRFDLDMSKRLSIEADFALAAYRPIAPTLPARAGLSLGVSSGTSAKRSKSAMLRNRLEGVTEAGRSSVLMRPYPILMTYFINNKVCAYFLG